MPLRLTHADIADFTDMLIKQIGCLTQIVFNLQDRDIGNISEICMPK